MNRYRLLCLVVCLLALGPVPAHAQDSLPPQVPVWDGHSPMQPDVIYQLPNCDPAQDPQAPCYTYLTQRVVAVQRTPTVGGSNVTLMIECSRHWTTNASNNTVVLQLIQTASVTWEWNNIFSGYATVLVNPTPYITIWSSTPGVYGIRNTSGPNLSPVGIGQRQSNGNITTNSSGQAFYFILPMSVGTTTLEVTAANTLQQPNWRCY